MESVTSPLLHSWCLAQGLAHDRHFGLEVFKKFSKVKQLSGGGGGTWLVQSVPHATPDLRLVSSIPKLGMEPT